MTRAQEWPFGMACYYADDVATSRRPRDRGKRPGDLAIQTKHKTAGSLYVDVLAARDRRDIGHVEWWGPVDDLTRGLLDRDAERRAAA